MLRGWRGGQSEEALRTGASVKRLSASHLAHLVVLPGLSLALGLAWSGPLVLVSVLVLVLLLLLLLSSSSLQSTFTRQTNRQTENCFSITNTRPSPQILISEITDQNIQQNNVLLLLTIVKPFYQWKLFS